MQFYAGLGWIPGRARNDEFMQKAFARQAEWNGRIPGQAPERREDSIFWPDQ
jgi:hypothetical protein